MAVKWGIMSTARINRKLLAGARLAEDAEVVAVASRDGAAAAAFASAHGIERALTGYDALLADRSVEAVYIPLPNSMHVDWTLRAIAAGKHVLCEKPMTRRPIEVEQVYDTASRAGVIVMEAFMYRFHPQTARLVSLVRDGAVGRVATVRSHFSYVARDLSNVRLQHGLDGGALMDLGCYCVSSARVVLGAEPERVFAEQVTGGDGVDVAMAATMRFPGDVLAHFDVGFEQVVRDELEIAGDEGALFLDDPWHCVDPVIELRRDDGVERIEIEALNPYMCEVANMSAAIRGEAEPLLGRADALAQARAIEALYSSAATGMAVGV